MSGKSTWSPVPFIEDGITTFSEADINPIIESLVERTDFLLNSINSLTGSHGYILPVHGLSEDCRKGDLIAYDRDTGMYTKARAIWESTEGRNTFSDGSPVPSHLASVIGVLLDNPGSDSKGTLLCAGWSRDPELIALLAAPGCGDYYLSSSSQGKAMRLGASYNDSGVRVYCYSYFPSGGSGSDTSGTLYVNPQKPEYAGHSHGYVDIPDNKWISVTTGNNPINDNNVKVYIDTALAGLEHIRAIVATNPNRPCLIKSGVEVSKELWGIENSYIYLKFEPIPGDKFSLHAINPLYADQPIITAINKIGGVSNKLIEVTSSAGKTWLGLNTDPVDRNTYEGTGVISISQGGVKSGPVVQGVRAGAGISVTSYKDKNVDVPGVVEISATQYKNTLIDMSVVNLNNVSVGTSFYGLSYIFPRNSSSSLVGTIRIPHYDGESQEGEIVLVFQGNGSTISNLTANIMVQPTPQAGGPGLPLAGTTSYTVPGIPASDESMCYAQTLNIPAGILRSDGLIICKLLSGGSSVINLVSMSLRLK
jgi:hypothetical protein